jgi:hypothetical protein
VRHALFIIHIDREISGKIAVPIGILGNKNNIFMGKNLEKDCTIPFDYLFVGRMLKLREAK